jgi:Cu(I)/Ag(I) efflux system membrane protein CusA/SilA
MIGRIIQWAVSHSLAVILICVFLFGWGSYVLYHTPVDAIPDLSDVQVIIKTKYTGRSPRIVQDQVTYPLTTTMMAVPGAKDVRGFSYFGESFVYVIFNEGTDIYWARSRVLEYLSQATSKLPSGVKPELGPDATGVGWIYQYALIDRTGKHDVAQLRAFQDWVLKFELRTVPGVSEVASVGGMVKQYQIIPDPDILRGLKISIPQITSAIQNANMASGGSVLELAEAEYMIQANGYLKSISDFESIPISTSDKGTPILLKEIAHIQEGPEMRRGISDLNGEGESVGGIIVMRYGQNALEVINAVKQKIETLKPTLPKGVEIVPTYDRSKVIQRSVQNLTHKVIEEAVAVLIVCLLFLMHMRSSFVIIITLPLGILMAFIVMYYQGVNANIMSLGGIAIAIGAMVDAAIVMIENAHKNLEAVALKKKKLTGQERVQVIMHSAIEVGPALFFSLLIITISFLPIFTLQAQEGKLFSPLALTKTYAMAMAAGLSITLVPVLMTLFIKGAIPSEEKNPLNRFLIDRYKRLLLKILKFPKATLSIAFLFIIVTLYPLSHLEMEFMPPLQEGDLLYMPSAFPGISAGKAAQILQQTDKMIKTVPEVQTVFGKAGRAETATDPAPLEMLETMIQLKDAKEWRPGMTLEKLIEELDQTVRLPGLINLWVQPIRNRIDMLSTGIKSPVGIKISGSDLAVIEKIGNQIEKILKPLKGTMSIYSERANLGRYINIDVKRDEAARYGLNISDIFEVIDKAVGGENIGEVIQGLERYPINIRYPRDWRDSLKNLKNIPLYSGSKGTVPLNQVATLNIIDGPSMYKSESARLAGWVYIDVGDRALGSYVREAQKILSSELILPAGYSLSWTGQYEYLERAQQRMVLIIPLTILAIFIMLFWIFHRLVEPLLIMLSLPFAVVGGIWLVYGLGYHLSIAVIVGFIALAGVAAEFGVIMLLYLKQALERRQKKNKLKTVKDLRDTVVEGAALRVRPKSMTVAVILAGLFPIMIGHGTGSDVMQRIAAPMIGGMLTAPILSMVIMPLLYMLWQKRQLKLKG